MSSEGTRRRRPSPAVYRRRRAVVLVGLLAVIALVVWLLIAQPWRGSADSTTPSATQTSPSPSPSTPTLPDPAATGGSNPADALPEDSAADATTDAAAQLTPEACTAESVSVEALTDKESYASGEIPQLSIRLTNTSATPCTINVGTTQQSFTITSGSDVWWRSTDCQAAPSDMVVTLAAGQVVESSAPIAWDRTRSSVSTCEGERQRAPGGGASYHLDVSIGGIPSLTSRQILLY